MFGNAVCVARWLGDGIWVLIVEQEGACGSRQWHSLGIRAVKEQRIISSADCQSRSDLTVLAPRAFVAFGSSHTFNSIWSSLNLYHPTPSRCASAFIHFLIHLYLLILVSFPARCRVHQPPPLLAPISLSCVEHPLWTRDTLALHNSTSIRFYLLNVSLGNAGHVVMWQKLPAFKSIQTEMDLTLTLLLYLLNSGVLSVSMQPTCLFVFD